MVVGSPRAKKKKKTVHMHRVMRNEKWARNPWRQREGKQREKERENRWYYPSQKSLKEGEEGKRYRGDTK